MQDSAHKHAMHTQRREYKMVQHQHDLYHVFIDFKKAFDRVWHAALWATTKKHNISAKHI